MPPETFFCQSFFCLLNVADKEQGQKNKSFISITLEKLSFRLAGQRFFHEPLIHANVR
jgi:hypothetical protein